MEFIHKSVLFDEAIAALELSENKIVADGTAGGGGHSREIAKKAKRLYQGFRPQSSKSNSYNRSFIKKLSRQKNAKVPCRTDLFISDSAFAHLL